MKKWILTISSEMGGFLNWEGVLGSYWYGVKYNEFQRYFPICSQIKGIV